MNRTASPCDFQEQRDLSRSKSQRRSIYLNQETLKRDVSTPFHSPYKQGKPNPHYHNPSFISSHLFYPPQYALNTNTFHVTNNLIPNPNDLKKQALQKQKLKTEPNKPQPKIQQRNRQFNNSKISQPKILRSNQPETLLKNQLQNLHNYRQKYQKNKARLQEMSRRKPQRAEQPIYLQTNPIKSRRTATLSSSYSKQNLPAQNKEQCQQLKALKQQFPSDKYSANLDRLIQQNNQLLQQQQKQRQKQSQLLGEVLREQIKTNRVLKERRWNY